MNSWLILFGMLVGCYGDNGDGFNLYKDLLRSPKVVESEMVPENLNMVPRSIYFYRTSAFQPGTADYDQVAEVLRKRTANTFKNFMLSKETDEVPIELVDSSLPMVAKSYIPRSPKRIPGAILNWALPQQRGRFISPIFRAPRPSAIE